MTTEIWSIGVPTHWYPNGVRILRQVSKKHHKEWSRKVGNIRDINNVSTLLCPSSWRITNTGGNILEARVVIRDTSNSGAYKKLQKIVKMTKMHYHAKKVLCYIISDNVETF